MDKNNNTGHTRIERDWNNMEWVGGYVQKAPETFTIHVSWDNDDPRQFYKVEKIGNQKVVERLFFCGQQTARYDPELAKQCTFKFQAHVSANGKKKRGNGDWYGTGKKPKKPPAYWVPNQ